MGHFLAQREASSRIASGCSAGRNKVMNTMVMSPQKQGFISPPLSNSDASENAS
jgi:hypothetical protein